MGLLPAAFGGASPGGPMAGKAHSSAANHSYLGRRIIKAVIPVKDQKTHRHARGQRSGPARPCTIC